MLTGLVVLFTVLLRPFFELSRFFAGDFRGERFRASLASAARVLAVMFVTLAYLGGLALLVRSIAEWLGASSWGAAGLGSLAVVLSLELLRWMRGGLGSGRERAHRTRRPVAVLRQSPRVK